MKKLLLTLILFPAITEAQNNPVADNLLREALGLPPLVQQVPQVGIPVQPVLPVPQDRGPFNTGYSIVTTTREKRSLWDRDLTGEETVQRIVPNDALGQPIKGMDLGW